MMLAFWISIGVIAYVYAGYPLLLAAWARRTRSVRRTDLPMAATQPDALPRISIVIAARNEEQRLPARIANLLDLDYPADRRQIVVVSDGSTDGTVHSLAHLHEHVEVIALSRGGKSAALNAGVARARHEILVFADARQVFARDALRALVAPFADPAIGGVSGELVLDCEQTAPTSSASSAESVGLYWRYEKWIRRQESTIASMLGATGAIYALRRSLWRALPPQTLLDDVLAPMRAVLAGRRVVLEERAKAFDRATATSQAEARRKVRTLAGNVQILWLEPRLLVPIVNPVWLQYWSHKVGRLVVPYALMTLFASSLALAGESLLFAAALAGQCGLYFLGGYGAWLEWTSQASVNAGRMSPRVSVGAEP